MVRVSVAAGGPESSPADGGRAVHAQGQTIGTLLQPGQEIKGNRPLRRWAYALIPRADGEDYQRGQKSKDQRAAASAALKLRG